MAYQWTVLDSVLNILSEVEELTTRDLRSHSSRMSDIIPAVLALKLHLETKVQDTSAKTMTMKAGLISSIDSRFQ